MPTKKKAAQPVTKPMAKKKSATKKVAAKKPASVEHQVHHKYVLMGVCSSCDHLPMRANKLVAMLSFVIVLLSGMIISMSAPLDLDLQFSWGIDPITLDRSFASTR